MVINIWDIFKYIYKWKWLIAAVVIVCIMFSSFYVATNQSYSAEVVISFTDPNIASGKNPLGENFDVYEIVAPSVISAAIAELQTGGSVSGIRRSITINPIIPQSILDIKESKTKAGEEYTYYPNEYSIKYTVGSSSSGAEARDVLEAVMKAYGIEYADKYLNPYVLPRADFDLSTETHDYIEIAEIMKNKVDETIEYLTGKVEASAGYRSPKTGYTFSDILKEYNMLKQFDISALYSDIFTGRVTQNREILLKKYQRRVDNYAISRQSKLEESVLAHDLMERYVSSSTKNPSTWDGYKTDSQNVIESFYDTEIKPDQATYDDLVMAYANAGVEAENLQVDSDYCQTVLDIFGTEVYEEQNNIYTQRVVESIDNLSSKMKKYYDVIDQIARDYNTYSASQQIVNKSAVSITANVPMRMHVLVAIVFGIGAGVIAAIAIEVIKKMRQINANRSMRRRQLSASASGYGAYASDYDIVDAQYEQADGDDIEYDTYDDYYDDTCDEEFESEEPAYFEVYKDADKDADEDADEDDEEDEDDNGYDYDDDSEIIGVLDDSGVYDYDDLSAEELAEIDDIKNYSSRAREEYDPNKHYKWPDMVGEDSKKDN